MVRTTVVERSRENRGQNRKWKADQVCRREVACRAGRASGAHMFDWAGPDVFGQRLAECDCCFQVAEAWLPRPLSLVNHFVLPGVFFLLCFVPFGRSLPAS
jgi:hypothetical protein